jgi:hypothetical protein
MAAGALLVVTYLDIAWIQQVDPILDPVSDYFFHNGVLFVLAVLQLMAGGLAVTVGMNRAGMPRVRAATVLFRLWLAGLAVVAVFPGNPSVDVSTVSGEIHRFGGAVFLTCLPAACWLLARALHRDPLWTVAARRIRWFTGVSLVTAASFGVAQFVHWLPQGLLERFALGAEVALVVVLALIIRRAAP